MATSRAPAPAARERRRPPQADQLPSYDRQISTDRGDHLDHAVPKLEAALPA
jgi:hypothetical protein